MSDHGEPLRAVVFGLGTIGSAAVQLAAQRPWLEVVGAVVATPRTSHGSGFPVTTEPDDLLDRTRPDVALIATRPTVTEVMPDIERCARRGISVICTAEELACPSVGSPEYQQHLSRLAAETHTTIAATGINPGFVFDVLPLVMAGAAWDVPRISVSRSLDASVFGRTVHRSLGVGYTPAAFAEALSSRVIRGHIGFEESANTIAQVLGVDLDGFREQIDPVYAERPYQLAEYRIEPGNTAGVSQTAVAQANGKDWLEFDLTLHVDPESVDMATRDRIVIEGQNAIDLTIQPGTHAVRTTTARLVNTVPAVISAEPGFYGAAELLPAAPWLGERLPSRGWTYPSAG
jgi:4-hydroxy-tetrahydrodipicolinate reductase